MNRDKYVVTGGLVLGYLIAVVGLAWEFSLLSVAFAFIGIAGLLTIVLGIFWGGLAVVDYIAGHEAPNCGEER